MRACARASGKIGRFEWPLLARGAYWAELAYFLYFHCCRKLSIMSYVHTAGAHVGFYGFVGVRFIGIS